ncbi:LysR family transcriptional regulator [Sphingomonas sp. UYP23]
MKTTKRGRSVDAMSRAVAEPSIIQLQCLLAVVDTGSFAAAGRRIGLTTSGVSKTISRLETGQGVRLLHRSTHSLALTEAGEQIIDAARVAARGIEQLRAAMAEAAEDGARGRVRVTAPVAFVRRRLTPLLAEFSANHPTTLLDVRASDEMVNLAEEAVDLALRAGELVGVPGHLQQPWFNFEWAACASPDYIARRGIPATPAELDDHHLIGFRNTRTGLVEPWWFASPSEPGAVERVSFTPRIVFDDAEGVWRAATLGFGIAWVPTWLAAEELAQGAIIEVLREWRGKRSPMSIVRRDSLHTPTRTKALISFLKGKAASFD